MILTGVSPTRCCRVDSGQHALGTEAAAGHALEDLLVVAVQAHGDSPETRVLERLRPLGKEIAVGGEGEILHPVDRGQSFDQLGKLVAEQRLASGHPELRRTEGDEEARQPLDLLEAQDLVSQKELVLLAVDVPGHAVAAAKVAAIRHGNAQIAQRASGHIQLGGGSHSMSLHWFRAIHSLASRSLPFHPDSGSPPEEGHGDGVES